MVNKSTLKKKTNSDLLETILKTNNLKLLNTQEKKEKISTYVTKGKNKDKFILRVSNSTKGDLNLKNQSFWLKQVNKHLPENSKFMIEEPVKLGFEGSRVWLILKFIDGKPFAKIKNGISIIQVAKPEKYFENITNLLHFLEGLNTTSIKQVDKRFGSKASTDKLKILESAVKQSRNSTPLLADLLQIIEKNYKDLSKSTNQCDITPINLMVTKRGKIALVDCDLGNLNIYKYYDVAEFYNRLYTRVCKPTLADNFLSIYTKGFSKKKKEKFFKNFLALSALRCIGNITEISGLPQDQKEKRLEYAKKFAYDIVSYKIINNQL
jgi:hypothetical protein